MLEGKNVIVLDLETLRSANDCKHCGAVNCDVPSACVNDEGHVSIGWDDKAALGLSIGCYWEYKDGRIHWFDAANLEVVMRELLDWLPLMVSFNGVQFDFPLMCRLLEQQATVEGAHCDQDTPIPSLIELSHAFEKLGLASYDILQEIWKKDPANKYKFGLNSLDAIAQASGLGAKLSHGAQAPRDWRDGRVAQVLNYCQDDVYKTKALFEMICEGRPIIRGDGKPITLPKPVGIL